jgi:hypothetical protein
MNILKRPNKIGDKITSYYDYGRGLGQRLSIGRGVLKKCKSRTSLKKFESAAWIELSRIKCACKSLFLQKF